MSKEENTKRGHRWRGAGNVCADCEAIRGTDMGNQPCEEGAGFDLWLYYDGAGWRLSDVGVGGLDESARIMADAVGTGSVIAGAIIQQGQSIDLLFSHKR